MNADDIKKRRLVWIEEPFDYPRPQPRKHCLDCDMRWWD